MKIVAIGEAMLELSSAENGLFALAYGGDTLNTAVYIARLGGSVSYFTALGTDKQSEDLLAQWQAEGVNTGLVYRDAESSPGLYMIETDATGERSFAYWRGESAAKRYFQSVPEEHWQPLYDFDFLFISGISLSLFSEDCFARFLAFLGQYRERGGKVVFDINYRPKNWSSEEQARQVISKMLQATDIALPSFEDEQLLFGDQQIDDCLQRYQLAGVTEILVKNGADGCTLITDSKKHYVPLDNPITPLDTTAAGDSFNAGYLAGRMRGLSAEQATRVGQQCAAQVIQHKGAIIPKAAFTVSIDV